MTTTQDRFGGDFGAERMWGLKELALPDAPGWLPLAPGWYVVIAGLLLATIVVAWRLFRRWRLNQYRRDAVGALGELRADGQRLAEVAFILRRTALQAYPRRQVAGLRGQQWIGWLNETAGAELFAPADAELLDRLTYATDSTAADAADIDRLLGAATSWAKQHHAVV